MSTIGSAADRLPELLQELAASGQPAVGAPLLRYREFSPDGTLLVEAGVPVAVAPDPRALPADATNEMLPAGPYATVTHTGPFAGLATATGALLRWADEQGLRWDREVTPDHERWASRIEVYRTDPRSTPPDQWETDILIRLADAPGPRAVPAG